MRTHSQFIGFRCPPGLRTAIEKEFPHLTFSQVVRLALELLLDMKKAA